MLADAGVGLRHRAGHGIIDKKWIAPPETSFHGPKARTEEELTLPAKMSWKSSDIHASTGCTNIISFGDGEQ